MEYRGVQIGFFTQAAAYLFRIHLLNFGAKRVEVSTNVVRDEPSWLGIEGGGGDVVREKMRKCRNRER